MQGVSDVSHRMFGALDPGSSGAYESPRCPFLETELEAPTRALGLSRNGLAEKCLRLLQRVRAPRHVAADLGVRRPVVHGSNVTHGEWPEHEPRREESDVSEGDRIGMIT